MSVVDRISGGIGPSQIERLNESGRSSRAKPSTPYQVRDGFDFSQVGLDEDSVPDLTSETESLAAIINEMLMAILVDGCRIISKGALTSANKKEMIEASFRPPLSAKQKPEITVPIKGLYHPLEPINHLLVRSRIDAKEMIDNVVSHLSMVNTNAELVKLIVLIAHEYGHFKSYQRGYHDVNLKLALGGMHSGTMSPQLGYAVFGEEVMAWNFGKDILTRRKFTYWDAFEKVMYASLSAYYNKLNLANADIATYCKLSLLGVDLQKVDLRKPSNRLNAKVV